MKELGGRARPTTCSCRCPAHINSVEPATDWGWLGNGEGSGEKKRQHIAQLRRLISHLISTGFFESGPFRKKNGNPHSKMTLPLHVWSYLDDDSTKDRFYQEAGTISYFLVIFGCLGAFLDRLSHWWCQHADVIKEFLFLFEKDLPVILEFQKTMGMQMAKCPDCVEAYYEGKDQQIQAMYAKR